MTKAKTSKTSKVTKSQLSKNSVTCVSFNLIKKYQCLPTVVVRDYAQRLTKNKYSQEAISDALRKLYANKKIDRLARGVYCIKGLV